MHSEDRLEAIRVVAEVEDNATLLRLTAEEPLTEEQLEAIVDAYEEPLCIYTPNGATNRAVASAEQYERLRLLTNLPDGTVSSTEDSERRSDRAVNIKTENIRSRLLKTMFGMVGTSAARLGLLLQQFRGSTPLHILFIGDDALNVSDKLVDGVRASETDSLTVDCRQTTEQALIGSVLPTLQENQLLILDSAYDFEGTFDFLRQPLARGTYSSESGSYQTTFSCLAHLKSPSYHADFASMLNTLPFGRVRSQFDMVAAVHPEGQPPSIPTTIDMNARPLSFAEFAAYRTAANNLHPSLETDVEAYLTQEVAEQRQEQSVEPYRQAEMTRAVIRLSRAAARTELRTTVSKEDVDLAIALLTLDVGAAAPPEPYEQDVGVERVILDILTVLETEYKTGVPKQLLLHTALNSIPNEDVAIPALERAVNDLIGEEVVEVATDTYVTK